MKRRLSALLMVASLAPGFLPLCLPRARQIVHPPCLPGDTGAALNDMWTARSIHYQWAAYEQANGNVANVGDPAWHLAWAARYDNTLTVLAKAKAFDAICR